MKRLIISILALSISITAFSWGKEGHDAVCAIAQCNLKESTVQAMQPYLDGRSILYYASWPDQIRFIDEYDGKWMKWGHVANYDANFIAILDESATGPDALVQIQAIIDKLKGGAYKQLPKEEVSEYIKYLVHAVGDMHCPGHMIVDGNKRSIKLTFGGKSESYHAVWDANLITAWHKWSPADYAAEFGRVDENANSLITAGTVRQWGESAARKCAVIWDWAEEGCDLSKPFVYKAGPLADEMIQLAGFRLAKVLNVIFSDETYPCGDYPEGEKYQSPYELEVMSFNINKSDPKATENKWEDRMYAVQAMLKEQNPAILGTQECRWEQKEDLEHLLGKEWGSIGVGMYDGKKDGPTNSIFYRKDRVEVLRSGAFWYSDTPDVPKSRYPEASQNCYATWAVFKDLTCGKEFILVNTHLDYKSEDCRALQAKLILEKLDELGRGLPAIVMGDFNAKPCGTFASNPKNPGSVLCSRLKDGRRLSISSDLVKSYNSYGKKDPVILDYIFYSEEFEGIHFKTIKKKYEKVKYISDHYPIRQTLIFK
ncbi:MAG: S1/P1 nuclease [Candidatus Cryptobacteroides sp.]